MEQDTTYPAPERQSSRAKSSTPKTTKTVKNTKAKTNAVVEANRQKQTDQGIDHDTRSDAPSIRESPPTVFQRIRERAYWLYVSGGYQHGYDIQHWLEAERQILDSAERQSERT